MPKVVIRSGDDWLTVEVDGESIIDGHSGSPHDWVEVLQTCGVEVDYDGDGNFCAYCTKWTKDTKRTHGDDVCPECYDKYKDED